MSGHDKITSQGREFYSEIEKLIRLECRVGFQRGTKAKKRSGNIENGVPDLVDVALWNEFGTKNSPSRPFLRQSVDDNLGLINYYCKKLVKDFKNGAPADYLLNSCGKFGKKLIQEKIKSGNFSPNAPSTIKKKGSNKPLIDTGHMRNSVNFVIQEKGEGD